MGRFVDKICIGVAIFILCFVLIVSISHNLILSLIASILLSLIITLVAAKLSDSSPQKHLNCKNYDTYMIVQGIEYQLDILMKLYPDATCDNTCVVTPSGIIMPIIKFGALSLDDIVKAYRVAKNKASEDIFIISNNIERHSIAFSNNLYDVHFHFVKTKELYNIVKTRNMLPLRPKNPHHKHTPIRDLLALMLARGNAPKFLFTSFILLLLSLITPLKGYYLSFSAISSILCLLSILGRDRLLPSNKLPKIDK